MGFKYYEEDAQRWFIDRSKTKKLTNWKRLNGICHMIGIRSVDHFAPHFKHSGKLSIFRWDYDTILLLTGCSGVNFGSSRFLVTIIIRCILNNFLQHRVINKYLRDVLENNLEFPKKKTPHSSWKWSLPHSFLEGRYHKNIFIAELVATKCL